MACHSPGMCCVLCTQPGVSQTHREPDWQSAQDMHAVELSGMLQQVLDTAPGLADAVVLLKVCAAALRAQQILQSSGHSYHEHSSQRSISHALALWRTVGRAASVCLLPAARWMSKQAAARADGTGLTAACRHS